MDPANVTATLEILTSDISVEARVDYKNVSDKVAFLMLVNAGLTGELENDIFKIAAEDGTEVAYSGTLAKRPKPLLQDFQRLEPGQSVTARVRLDHAYTFLGDRRHEYKVVYSAYHQYPERTGFWELVSNEAHFAFGKKK